MTESDLIAAGYRPYPGPGLWQNADRCFQRTIRAGGAKLYFINFGLWDNSKYPGFPKGQDPIGFEAKAHFYRPCDRAFRLAIPVRDEDTVEAIEREYAEFYAAMGCVPDIHNQD